MKHTCRLWFFDPMDADGIEACLSKMARKGWQLERAGRYFWRFHRAEPAPLAYAVTYFADSSLYGGAATAAQDELAEYCAAVGWDYVTQWQRMQIFASNRPDPVPLETDEGQKLRVIEAALGKDRRLSCLAGGLFFALFCLLVGLAAFFPLSFLTTPYVLVLMVGYPLALLCLVLRALYRTAWLRRSRRAVELGGACAPGGFRLFHRVNIALVLLLALLFLHGAWYAGASGVLSGLYSIRYLLLASLIVWWMRERSYTDRSIVNALLLLLGAALLIGFLRASWTPKLVEIEPEYWYTDEEGVIYGIYDDPVPLTLADFDVDVGEYPVSTAVMSASRSPLASRQKCHVYSPAGGDGAPHLYYTVIRTISPALAELCLRDPDLSLGDLSPASDGGWQAQAVWVGGTGQTLLVRWETAILSLSFNDALTLTRQQKDAIRQTVLTAVA